MWKEQRDLGIGLRSGPGFRQSCVTPYCRAVPKDTFCSHVGHMIGGLSVAPPLPGVGSP